MCNSTRRVNVQFNKGIGIFWNGVSKVEYAGMIK